MSSREKKWATWIPRVRAVASVVILSISAYSFYLACRGWNASWSNPGDVHVKICQVVAWCLWTILPPSYFLFEYWIFTNAYPPTQDSVLLLDRLKNSQDLASKVWLAIATVLFVLYFHKELGYPPIHTRDKASESRPPRNEETKVPY